MTEVKVVGAVVVGAESCRAEYSVECFFLAQDEAPTVAERFDRVDYGLGFGFDYL